VWRSPSKARLLSWRMTKPSPPPLGGADAALRSRPAAGAIPPSRNFPSIRCQRESIRASLY